MSTLAAVRRGLPALLAVYALRTLCALLVLGPLYGELSHALQTSVFGATATPGDAALALELLARSAPPALPGAVVWLAAYALLGPWLQQLLLLALGGVSLRAALLPALHRYPAALAVRAAAIGLGGLAIAAVVLALDALFGLLPSRPALELGLRVFCCAGLAACALWLASLHDLAQARIALGSGALRGVLGARGDCTRGALACNALALTAATVIALLAELAGRVPLALPYAAGPMLVLAVQQTLLFAALLVRAAWLSHTLTRTAR